MLVALLPRLNKKVNKTSVGGKGVDRVQMLSVERGFGGGGNKRQKHMSMLCCSSKKCKRSSLSAIMNVQK